VDVINFFTDASGNYNSSGRFDYNLDSLDIQNKLKSFLKDKNINYTLVNGDIDSKVNSILNHLGLSKTDNKL